MILDIRFTHAAPIQYQGVRLYVVSHAHDEIVVHFYDPLQPERRFPLSWTEAISTTND